MNLKEKLLELLEIPSPTGEEGEISNYIYNFLQERGLSPERIGNNIVCKLNDTEGENIALIGHLDTVPPQGESVIKEEGSEIYGRGSVDMKSGLACMLEIIEDLEDLDKTVYLYFYTEEEGPLPNGLNRLMDEGRFEDIDFAVVLEPTRSTLDLGCYGRLEVEYRFDGKAAHSAFHKEGENAVYKAVSLIEKIKDLDIPEKDGIKEGINVTRMEASGPTNQIPEKCTVTVDYRFSPKKSTDEAVEDISKIVGEPTKVVDSSPGAIVDEDNKFIRSVEEKDILRHWTDMTQLNKNGVVAVNFGPGDHHLAHSAEEHINIENLEEFYEKLLEFLQY